MKIPMTPEKDPISIAITLGKGAVLAITESNELIFEQGDHRIEVGKATVWKIELIKECVERIGIHAVDYKRKEK